MSELFLSLTQNEIQTPYVFKATRIKVFSFEEALFHCFYYWKQSSEDFCSEEFIQWVNNILGLPLIAAQLKEIARIESFSQKFYSFLTVTDYFKRSDLHLLREEVEQWENRLDWEKLKEQGDYFMNHGDYEKAQLMYQRAVQTERNDVLLNNLAISLMKQEKYEEASAYLEQAVTVSSTDNRCVIMKHLTECLVFAAKLDKAKDMLLQINKLSGYDSDLFYLQGNVEFAGGNVSKSVFFYEKAIESAARPEYIYKLAEVYVKLRQFEKALTVLGKIENKDKFYLKTLAEIYAGSNNVPAAIKCMERALIMDMGSVDVWTRLAKYHRLDYDLNRANSAIIKALAIDPDNERANLEAARIKKTQGKIKEYQTVLKKVLGQFKTKYRELE